MAALLFCLLQLSGELGAILFLQLPSQLLVQRCQLLRYELVCLGLCLVLRLVLKLARELLVACRSRELLLDLLVEPLLCQACLPALDRLQPLGEQCAAVIGVLLLPTLRAFSSARSSAVIDLRDEDAPSLFSPALVVSTLYSSPAVAALLCVANLLEPLLLPLRLVRWSSPSEMTPSRDGTPTIALGEDAAFGGMGDPLITRAERACVHAPSPDFQLFTVFATRAGRSACRDAQLRHDPAR